MPYKEASSFEATKSVWGASKTTTVKESRSVAVGDAAAADILLMQWNILAPAWLPATATVLRDDGSAEYWTVCTNTRLGGESYVGDFSPHYLTVCVCVLNSTSLNLNTTMNREARCHTCTAHAFRCATYMRRMMPYITANLLLLETVASMLNTPKAELKACFAHQYVTCEHSVVSCKNCRYVWIGYAYRCVHIICIHIHIHIHVCIYVYMTM